MIAFVGINYFFNNMKDIDPNLLSINKVLRENTGIIVHETKYHMMQSINNQNIDREVPLCLTFSNADAYIIEENGNKCLILALTENNKEVLELLKKLWNEINYHIMTINSGKCNSIEYGNDIMKIILNPHDDVLLNKMIRLSSLNIFCKSVFQIQDKYYPQFQPIGEC